MKGETEVRIEKIEKWRWKVNEGELCVLGLCGPGTDCTRRFDDRTLYSCQLTLSSLPQRKKTRTFLSTLSSYSYYILIKFQIQISISYIFRLACHTVYKLKGLQFFMLPRLYITNTSLTWLPSELVSVKSLLSISFLSLFLDTFYSLSV